MNAKQRVLQYDPTATSHWTRHTQPAANHKHWSVTYRDCHGHERHAYAHTARAAWQQAWDDIGQENRQR